MKWISRIQHRPPGRAVSVILILVLLLNAGGLAAAGLDSDMPESASSMQSPPSCHEMTNLDEAPENVSTFCNACCVQCVNPILADDFQVSELRYVITTVSVLGAATVTGYSPPLFKPPRA